MSNTRISKTKRLIAYLKRYGKIEPMKALNKFGIYRLGARIFDLRHRYGWDIRTDKFTDNLGEEHAVYHVLKAGNEPK